MQNASNMLSFGEVLEASRKNDADKKDIYCKMGDVTFLARDIKDFDVEDEGKKTRSGLHAQISVPDPDTGTRIRLDFCLNSFKQFAQTHLGIPHQYLMKCPAALAKDQVNHWKGTMADADLLIRTRVDRAEGSDYARAVLSGSYGRLDNTDLLVLAEEIAKEADMQVFRFDMPDHSMHIKAVLRDSRNLGTAQNPDPVHFGFHLANSETGNRSVTWDIMTFRLVCSNGLVTLIDGQRMISQQHRGDVDIPNLKQSIREKCNEAILKQDAIFGQMAGLRDQKLIDPFEEARAVWVKYKLPGQHRNHVFNLLTETYTDGTRWDIVNALTECAQALADNPDIRLRMEEAAGKYMQLERPLLVGVGG